VHLSEALIYEGLQVSGSAREGHKQILLRRPRRIVVLGTDTNGVPMYGRYPMAGDELFVELPEGAVVERLRAQGQRAR